MVRCLCLVTSWVLPQGYMDSTFTRMETLEMSVLQLEDTSTQKWSGTLLCLHSLIVETDHDDVSIRLAMAPLQAPQDMLVTLETSWPHHPGQLYFNSLIPSSLWIVKTHSTSWVEPSWYTIWKMTLDLGETLAAQTREMLVPGLPVDSSQCLVCLVSIDKSYLFSVI